MDIGNDLTPHQFRLVLPSGSTCPVMHQLSFSGLEKSPVRADLAIYSHAVDVSGWWMSVSSTLGIKLDFQFLCNMGQLFKIGYICYFAKIAFIYLLEQ